LIKHGRFLAQLDQTIEWGQVESLTRISHRGYKKPPHRAIKLSVDNNLIDRGGGGVEQTECSVEQLSFQGVGNRQGWGSVRSWPDLIVGDEVPAELPDTRVQSADVEIVLRQALAGLDEQSRDLCILIAIEGYAYDEVSAKLGLPLGSIGPMYIRAKSKMRMQMAA
jgi:hypothetical protein